MTLTCYEIEFRTNCIWLIHSRIVNQNFSIFQFLQDDIDMLWNQIQNKLYLTDSIKNIESKPLNRWIFKVAITVKLLVNYTSQSIISHIFNQVKIHQVEKWFHFKIHQVERLFHFICLMIKYLLQFNHLCLLLILLEIYLLLIKWKLSLQTDQFTY